MAAAYATLASGGMYAPPVLVTSITVPMAETFRSPRSLRRGVRWARPEAYLTTSLLSSVVDHGTAAAARCWVAQSRVRPVPATRQRCLVRRLLDQTSCARRGRATTMVARSAPAKRAPPQRFRVDFVHAGRSRETPSH